MESKWKGTTTAREDRSWKRPPFLSCPRGILFTITSGTQEATILLSLTRVSPRNKFKFCCSKSNFCDIFFFRYLEKFSFRIFNKKKKKEKFSFLLERMKKLSALDLDTDRSFEKIKLAFNYSSGCSWRACTRVDGEPWSRKEERNILQPRFLSTCHSVKISLSR